MNILLLKNFNNYFNRVVKKYSDLADYRSNSSAYLDFANINFNPNDGIATELVIGGPTQTEGDQVLFWEYNGTPDYLVAYDIGDGVNIIRSRWFILESVRTATGQYRVALKRDILAEKYDAIMAAPCFVEKGIISNSGDPMLFNKENMSFNQIKQSEILLKDNTKSGWIVGYVSQDKTRYPASDYYESTSPVATAEDWANVPDEIKTLITNGSFNRPVAKATTSWGVAAGRLYINSINWKCASTPKYQGIGWTNVPWAGEASAGYQAPQYDSVPFSGYLVLNGTGFTLSAGNTVPVGAAEFADIVRYNTSLRNYYINNILTNGVDFDDTVQADIEAWNGRFVEKDNKIYQLKYEVTQSRHAGDTWTLDSASIYYYTFRNLFVNYKNDNSSTAWFTDGSNSILTSSVSIGTNGDLQLAWEVYTAQITLEEVSSDAGYIIKTYMPADRIQACDTPMDIFAIPYSDNFKIYTSVDAETGDPDPSSLITLSKQVALQAAISLAQAGSNVYDIQILPYFPNPAMVSQLTFTSDSQYDDEGLIGNNTWLNTGLFTEDTHFNYFYNSNGTKIGIIFWSRTSTFTTDINTQITLPDQSPLTLKLSNECELYRLTSPNYAGSFEFSLAKSGGRVDKFNADCTYKPYSPYIHVTPDLAGLYGANFSNIDDARGLICGGDFSITKIVNQWEQYELQNKNYQNIFDRQMQNMDVNNKIAQEQLQFNTTQNLVNMALNSANPVSSITNFGKTAIASPLFTSLGATKEADWLRRSQAEAKDYAQDMYGYQLGNIQALPYSLSRTAAQTNNNKIFPFVEYFTCTSTESEALLNKIEYNGMTVMKVGTLNDYSYSTDFEKVYVKGQLVRLDNLGEDFQVANSIYQEVNKGFFIEQD